MLHKDGRVNTEGRLRSPNLPEGEPGQGKAVRAA